MGDFNINILQYDNNKRSQEFLDKMQSNFLLPDISSPYRIIPPLQTLIDNIFLNKIEVESFWRKITTIISDHYAPFLLLKKVYKKIDKKPFNTDLKSTNSNQILKLNLGNTNDSFEIFLENFKKY